MLKVLTAGGSGKRSPHRNEAVDTIRCGVNSAGSSAVSGLIPRNLVSEPLEKFSRGAHAPQEDNMRLIWGFHCPPGHPGTRG